MAVAVEVMALSKVNRKKKATSIQQTWSDRVVSPATDRGRGDSPNLWPNADCGGLRGCRWKNC